MHTDQIIAKAKRAARGMGKRGGYGDDRYQQCDMVQDGCLAELQVRSAWYGVIDGLRSWLGRRGRLEILSLMEDIDIPTQYPDPLRCLIAAEQLERHQDRLDRMKPKVRCAYMLYRHEGKTARTTALILGVCPQRVVQMVAEVDKLTT